MTEERIALMKEIIESDEPSFIRWDGFLIAEVDGVPAAGLSGYETKLKSGEVYSQLLLEGMKRRGWTETAIDEYHKRSYGVLAVWPDLHDVENHWVVEWVATRPEYRRRGLVNQLLLRVLDIGREKGYKKAQVSLMIENAPARRAYEKLGFSEYNTITSPLLSKLHLKTTGILNLRMSL
ncbi:acetyltransferase, GNAT superfamily protein [Acanthamoeba castellanii str. Neff]|uniref:Acetyltransferase, GNAT superfamily protein n=1 Tax=Acanthamoeba castellanii (strain ATCC 30010 / Neff) TaxID=1257118 RepID=L8GLR2_ACACF|nr:acetyltransferase, GNAT superfamily protein [Acanthamoeba castellanii str. Neff]ELR14015.1 acetyltransferase, GNAT superfamily protein [Acanthamoeba castellanii str. Neff]